MFWRGCNVLEREIVLKNVSSHGNQFYFILILNLKCRAFSRSLIPYHMVREAQVSPKGGCVGTVHLSPSLDADVSPLSHERPNEENTRAHIHRRGRGREGREKMMSGKYTSIDNQKVSGSVPVSNFSIFDLFLLSSVG
jgi:hypothetical protein